MTVYGEGEHGEVIAVEPKCETEDRWNFIQDQAAKTEKWSEDLKKELAEPRCERCGMMEANHNPNPPYGNRIPGCDAYRPPTTEPSERCLIHDEPLDEKGFCPVRRIDKDAVQATIVTAPPALEDARQEDHLGGLHEMVKESAKRWVEAEGIDPDFPWETMALFAEQYADKRLAAERERIVDEFIADVEAEVDEVEFWRVRDIEEVQRILQAVKARGGVISAGK